MLIIVFFVCHNEYGIGVLVRLYGLCVFFCFLFQEISSRERAVCAFFGLGCLGA